MPCISILNARTCHYLILCMQAHSWLYLSAPALFSDFPKYFTPYKKKAANPASTAPALTNEVAAPPVNGVKVGDVELVVFKPVLLPVELLWRTKLAHVRRVVLLVWMTMERLPKKEPGPEAVER